MKEKKDDPKKIPFKAEELTGLKGKEFYLTVAAYNKAGKTLLKAFQKRGIEGAIGEIISRAPHNCSFYNIGNVAKAVCADGKNLGEKVKEMPAGMYIFIPDDIQIPDKQPPVMKGVARDYCIHDNSLGLEYRLTVTMADVPKFKELSGMMCG